MAGLTDAGLEIKTTFQIKEEILDTFAEVFGSDINRDDRAPFGQIASIFAEREGLLWEVVQSLYFSAFPDFASGNQLDLLIAYNGITRRSATFSAVDLVFTGTDGSIVPQGTGVTDPNDSTIIWRTIGAGTIGVVDTGQVTISAAPETAGAIGAIADSLTQINDPVFGVTSVTNPSAATPGTDEESDADVRLRRLQQLGRRGTATQQGIRDALLTLETTFNNLQTATLSEAEVFQNDTDFTDPFGRPPHSIEATVLFSAGLGADDDLTQVAQSIWDSKAAGIQTFGFIGPIAVVDANGDPQSVNFSTIIVQRVRTVIDVDVNQTLANGPIFPNDGDQEIINAIINDFNPTLGVGDDVLNHEVVAAVSDSVQGLITVSVQLGVRSSGILTVTNATGFTQWFDNTQYFETGGAIVFTPINNLPGSDGVFTLQKFVTLVGGEGGIDWSLNGGEYSGNTPYDSSDSLTWSNFVSDIFTSIPGVNNPVNNGPSNPAQWGNNPWRQIESFVATANPTGASPSALQFNIVTQAGVDGNVLRLDEGETAVIAIAAQDFATTSQAIGAINVVGLVDGSFARLPGLSCTNPRATTSNAALSTGNAPIDEGAIAEFSEDNGDLVVNVTVIP